MNYHSVCFFEGKRVYDTLEDGEDLFLQGIIDTAFEENGEWILVDYKTDRVKSGGRPHQAL